MRTKLICILTCLWMCAACSKDEMPAGEEFTDPNFIEYLHENHQVPVTANGKIDLNDAMTQVRLKAITQLIINDAKPIYDLTGIRNLVTLNKLYFNSEIETLDVSNMEYLTSLNCSGRTLTHLNIRNTPLLKELTCYGNGLSSLDLSDNPRLEFIFCSYNKLTSLDLKALPKLSYLICHNNRLTELDASGMTFDEEDLILSCGDQTDENGNAQSLRLTLSESHKEFWEELTEKPYNINIEVTFKP